MVSSAGSVPKKIQELANTGNRYFDITIGVESGGDIDAYTVMNCDEKFAICLYFHSVEKYFCGAVVSDMVTGTQLSLPARENILNFVTADSIKETIRDGVWSQLEKKLCNSTQMQRMADQEWWKTMYEPFTDSGIADWRVSNNTDRYNTIREEIRSALAGQEDDGALSGFTDSGRSSIKTPDWVDDVLSEDGDGDDDKEKE